MAKPKAVIEDLDQFNAYLAAQPLFKWLAQRQQEDATGMHNEHGRSTIQAPPKKSGLSAI